MSDKPTNCPNCGAALKNGKCEYCGTETQSPSNLEIEKYMNGDFKSCKEEMQSFIDRCEKSIESGEIERHEGLKIIADLRVRMNNN